MDRLKILSLLLTCAVSGCRENQVSMAQGELLVQPASVDFGRTWRGHRGTALLSLQNTGRTSMEIAIEVGAPFDAVTEAHLGGGEQAELELGVTAELLGVVEGTLRVSANGTTQQVPLRVEVRQPQACAPRDCRTATFNPATGGCDETVAADGVSCAETNRCIPAGVCAAGVCVGRARDCDDRDACTTDACDVATGCVHEAVRCPQSPQTCEVPVCSPATGCGFAPAADGASCGPNDCVNAQVCITGQCVSRPAPDGSQCKPATACRAPGVCRQQQCELPAPTALRPSWRYTPQAGITLAFFGHVDDDGNLYATETGPFVRNGIAGAPTEDRSRPATPSYLISLSPAGALRFKVEVASGCASCISGLWFSIDSAGRRLFFNAGGSTQARSTVDGRLLWAAAPTSGLPVHDARADGGAAFFPSSPLLVGSDGVAVPVVEGNFDHHSYVQVFDRATGAFLWQFHRKGHLYGTGVATGGELWASSANCWAVAGEMARLNGVGQPQQVKFVQWLPSIYGAGVAIGTATGRLMLMDSMMNLTDLTTLTGASAVSTPMLTGQQLVLWDNRALRSINLASGVYAFDYRGVVGERPEFELLRDGGVGWTADLPDGGMLGAIDGWGEELLNCPLSTRVESATAISRGRAYMLSAGEIVAYDVPGLDVEPSGWVTRHGSLQRGRGAR